MKKLNLFTVLSILVIILAVSCKNTNSQKNPIVGEWTITNAEGTAASSNQGMIYIFNDDGTLTTKYGTIETKYTYTTDNDTLTMNYNGGNSIILMWIYEINDNKMTLQNISDTSQKLELEK